jgi:type IV secretion system protein VirB9
MCTIELEPGEVLSGKAQIADQIRWDLKQFLIGSKDGPQTFIAVHPKVSGIDTNMIIPTDRRMYFLHLVSKPGQYIPRIAFSYQDDSDADWDQYKTKLASMTLAPIVAPRIVTPPEKPKAVAFCDKPNITRGYKFKSKHYVDFVPIDACDDGLYTSITLPPIVNKSTGPILVLGSARHAERPNLDMHGSTIIVHRLFTHAQLVEGTGRHALKVDIVSPRTHE